MLWSFIIIAALIGALIWQWGRYLDDRAAYRASQNDQKRKTP